MEHTIVTMILSLALLTLNSGAEQSVHDYEITHALNRELIVDDEIAANNIDVMTKDGIVTLSGEIEHLLAKERAQQLAEATVGVRAIVNLIAVDPPAEYEDENVARRIRDAWRNDPATESYELDAQVDDGMATLTGTTSSYTEKFLSESVAKGVRGVKGITNRIEVLFDTDRMDADIEADVQARLDNDVRVDNGLINVSVEDSTVTLSGTVGSLQEKSQATYNAWVTGVRAVNAEALEIEWWARDTMRRSQRFMLRPDSEIEKAVTDALMMDPRVSSQHVALSVDEGTVVLKGSVDNLQAKKSAEQDAKNTVGVRRVDNLLKIRTPKLTNDALKKRAAETLVNDPYINRYDLNIDVYSGWIYLSGEVNTSFEKSHAEQLVNKIKGAIGVVNNIVYNYKWRWRPDWEIREQIEEQLSWSPFVAAGDIKVTVDRGIATLTGRVTTWSERGEAEKNAYQGGAKDVINRLAVDYRSYGPASPYYYGYKHPYGIVFP
jgi:osmotically-inducible protein OsmY